MECRECGPLLIDYLLGELDSLQMSECRAHLDACPACRGSLQELRNVADAIAWEPEATPTASEAASLTRALNLLPMAAPEARPTVPAKSDGVAGFALASAVAFVVVGSLGGMQAFGRLDLPAFIDSLGAARIALAALIVVFVTTFIPIVVTTRRAPTLSGLGGRRSGICE